MGFEIILTKRARQDLESLDKFTQKRIVDKLRFYAADPIKYAEKLIDPSLGTFRFRVGKYRVIFDMEGKDLIILRVGHRKEIYR